MSAEAILGNPTLFEAIEYNNENIEKIKKLRIFGKKIGLAFQIIDDILGLGKSLRQNIPRMAINIRMTLENLPRLFGSLA